MIYTSKFQSVANYFQPSLKQDQQSASDFKFKGPKKMPRHRKPVILDPAGQPERDILACASPEEFCLLNFRKTKNNTHCTISRLFGVQKTLTSISGGAISTGGKGNGRRKTRYTQRMIFKFAYEKLLGYGFKYLVIHCSGPTLSKRYIFKNFYKRFKIIILKDMTPHAHNGCRVSKVRRV